MATVTRTFLVDDLDGSTEDVENVQISLDGTNFEIDLSAANAARVRDRLAGRCMLLTGASGFLGKADRILIYNTGSGYKYLEAWKQYLSEA